MRQKILPEVLQLDTSGTGYVATEELADAVDAAVLTGLPLLVTGEPGSGKTQLATAVHEQFDIPLLRFDTKSTSNARELLYSFDVVGRFYDAENVNRNLVGSGRNPGSPNEYVTLGPLGAAILLASETRSTHLKEYPNALVAFAEELAKYQEQIRQDIPLRSVVLVDEVDKAPRDFPNDLLNELERLRFRIQEANNQEIRSSSTLRPLVILTSNAERELPEPFLRRCAYFNIDAQAQLDTIVEKRLGVITPLTKAALDHYKALRRRGGWEKPPSIAELLIWLRLLASREIQPESITAGDNTVLGTYTVLFKTENDLKKAQGRS